MVIKHRAYEPACILRSRILDDSQRDEHQCLSKDDRHHIGSEQLQGDILAGTTVGLVTHDTLCILYGNLADTLYQNDRCTNNGVEDDDLNEEHHKATTSDSGESRADLLDECLRQTGDDTNHNDHRDTVSYTFISNALTEPEDKHTTCSQDDSGGNHEHRPADARGQRSTRLHLQVDKVARCLEQQDSHCQVPSVHANLLAAALALTLHLLEVRHSDSEELHYDRSRDVRHNTKRENRRIGECTTGEHIKQCQKTASGLLLQLIQHHRIDTRKHHE